MGYEVEFHSPSEVGGVMLPGSEDGNSKSRSFAIACALGVLVCVGRGDGLLIMVCSSVTASWRLSSFDLYGVSKRLSSVYCNVSDMMIFRVDGM